MWEEGRAGAWGVGWRVKRQGGQRVKTNLTNHRSLVRGKNYKSQPEWWVSQYEHGEVSWLSASVIQNVKELFRVKPEEMNCMTDKGKISMQPAVDVWETFFFCLTQSCANPVLLSRAWLKFKPDIPVSQVWLCETSLQIPSQHVKARIPANVAHEWFCAWLKCVALKWASCLLTEPAYS